MLLPLTEKLAVICMVEYIKSFELHELGLVIWKLVPIGEAWCIEDPISGNIDISTARALERLTH